MQVINHTILSLMEELNTIRMFNVRYENDRRLPVAVREQLAEEQYERESVLISLLKSEYNKQEKIERDKDKWLDKDKQKELGL